MTVRPTIVMYNFGLRLLPRVAACIAVVIALGLLVIVGALTS